MLAGTTSGGSHGVPASGVAGGAMAVGAGPRLAQAETSRARGMRKRFIGGTSHEVGVMQKFAAFLRKTTLQERPAGSIPVTEAGA